MPLLKNLRTNEGLDIAKKPIVIGRHSGDDMTVDDPKCSRGNSEIEFKNGKYYIKDRGSRNGTTLNGVLLTEPALLNFGDKILIGATELEFQKTPEKIDIKLTGYDIIEHTASGGMGKVFKARQISLDRIVAIKVLSPKFTNDSKFTENFINEARAAGRLNHPNLVQVHDVNKEFQPNGQVTYYFTMEFIDGKTIKEIIRDVGKMPWKQTLDILIDACRGLTYIHDSKLVHRDIKPDNLMIDADGKIKIADLGIALDVTDSDGQEVTEDGHRKIVGTPHYISPEQARGKVIDVRSDLYSLGATAYHMLTGETPFDGENSKEIIKKHVHETPKHVNELNPEVPTQLNELIFSMMSKDPNDRPQSTKDLLEKLEAIKGKFEKNKTRTRINRTKGKRAKTVRYLSAAIIGISLGLGIFYFYSSLDFSGKPKPKTSDTKTTNSAQANINSPSDAIQEKYKMAESFKSRNEFEKAIEVYNELKQTSSGDNATIDALIKKTEQLKSNFENQELQNQIDEEYKALISFRDKNKDDLFSILEEYKKFVKKYPKSEQSITVNKEIRNLSNVFEADKENKRFKEFVQLFQSMDSDFERLKFIQDNRAQFKTKESQDWLTQKEFEINQKSKHIVENAINDAKNLDSNILNEDFTLAMQRAKSYLQNYDNPQAKKVLNDKINEIEKKAKEYILKQSEESQQVFREFSFIDAINTLDSKAIKVKETKALSVLQSEINKLNIAKSIFEESIKYINEKTPIPLNYTETKGPYELKGKIISADQRTVTIEFYRNNSDLPTTTPKSWSKLELSKVYLILESALKESGEFENKKKDLKIFSQIFKVDFHEVDQYRLK